MNIQLNGIEIVKETQIVEEFFMGHVETINRKGSYEIIVKSGESEALPAVGMDIIKGIAISSDCKVGLVSSDNSTKITGQNIIIDNVDESNSMTITNLGEIVDSGEIETIAQIESTTSWTITDSKKNYSYSVLEGSPVIGPFNLEGASFSFIFGEYIYYENFTINDIRSKDKDGDVIEPPLASETGEAVANAIYRAIRNCVGGIDLVNVEYTANNTFKVTSLRPGEINMEFKDVSYSNRMYIGMSSSTLTYGTIDYSSMKLRVISGDEARQEYVINSIGGDGIVITIPTGTEPSIDDKYELFDPTKDATVKVLVWQ